MLSDIDMRKVDNSRSTCNLLPMVFSEYLIDQSSLSCKNELLWYCLMLKSESSRLVGRPYSLPAPKKPVATVTGTFTAISQSIREKIRVRGILISEHEPNTARAKVRFVLCLCCKIDMKRYEVKKKPLVSQSCPCRPRTLASGAPVEPCQRVHDLIRTRFVQLWGQLTSNNTNTHCNFLIWSSSQPGFYLPSTSFLLICLHCRRIPKGPKYVLQFGPSNKAHCRYPKIGVFGLLSDLENKDCLIKSTIN